MSVTTADEKLEEAKEYIRAAHAALLIVAEPETLGHDEFSPTTINTIDEVVVDLMKIRRKLST